MKYNGEQVPKEVLIDRIVSAFCNPIEQWKVEEYTRMMQCGDEFPNIDGYPSQIDDMDIGQQFMTGEEITEEHAGLKVWRVTDGHHRTLAAIEAGHRTIGVTLDYSCITIEEELQQFN